MTTIQQKAPAGRPGLEETNAGERRFRVDCATAEPLLQRLEAVQKSGKGWRARCPACGGRSRKVSVTETGDRVLVYCFGCGDAEAVLAAVGLTWADLHPPRTWPDSPEQQRAQRRALRESAWSAALEVLRVEAAVVGLAAPQIAAWKPLSVEDDRRLALAVERIGRAAVALTCEDSLRLDRMVSPARLVSIKRAAVDALRRELGQAERELEAAEAALEVHA